MGWVGHAWQRVDTRYTHTNTQTQHAHTLTHTHTHTHPHTHTHTHTPGCGVKRRRNVHAQKLASRDSSLGGAWRDGEGEMASAQTQTQTQTQAQAQAQATFAVDRLQISTWNIWCPLFRRLEGPGGQQRECEVEGVYLPRNLEVCTHAPWLAPPCLRSSSSSSSSTSSSPFSSSSSSSSSWHSGGRHRLTLPLVTKKLTNSTLP